MKNSLFFLVICIAGYMFLSIFASANAWVSPVRPAPFESPQGLTAARVDS